VAPNTATTLPRPEPLRERITGTVHQLVRTFDFDDELRATTESWLQELATLTRAGDGVAPSRGEGRRSRAGGLRRGGEARTFGEATLRELGQVVGSLARRPEAPAVVATPAESAHFPAPSQRQGKP